MAGLAENTLMEDDPCCTYHLDNIAESVNLPTSKPDPIQFKIVLEICTRNGYT
jgi:hypothetical protein